MTWRARWLHKSIKSCKNNLPDFANHIHILSNFMMTFDSLCVIYHLMTFFLLFSQMSSRLGQTISRYNAALGNHPTLEIGVQAQGQAPSDTSNISGNNGGGNSSAVHAMAHQPPPSHYKGSNLSYYDDRIKCNSQNNKWDRSPWP